MSDELPSAGWSTTVCKFEDLEPDSARKVEIGRLKVAIVRVGDDVYALADTCSHADVSLSEGEVLADELEIECWKHGSTFSLTSGAPSCLPATQPVQTFAVEVFEGDVVLTIEGDLT